MPIRAPMVTTPVPPTPVTRMPQGSPVVGSGLGQGGEAAARPLQGLALAQPAALDGDEARAEAVHAGVVLVAGRLVDGALAPELGFHRQDGHAVGLLPQSPQPSHTASLMKTRRAGSGNLPRFLRRRFSAAQVWS
jgi:hypothetical protein